MLQERTGEFGAETGKKERARLIARITRKRSSLLLPLAAAALAFGFRARAIFLPGGRMRGSRLSLAGGE